MGRLHMGFIYLPIGRFVDFDIAVRNPMTHSAYSLRAVRLYQPQSSCCIQPQRTDESYVRFPSREHRYHIIVFTLRSTEYLTTQTLSLWRFRGDSELVRR